MSNVEFSFRDFSKRIEPKWQNFWDEQQVYRAANPGEQGAEKEKFYCLDMFPYPSGSGLHVGHPLGYVATDILCRYKRMKGFNVLHPMGWDAFGLPAEQYAIQTGIHPAKTTQENKKTFKRQMRSLALSYDWSREVSTADPSYFKWTQWIFKKLYEKGLAYQEEYPVNWCPALGTVLANDEIIDGKSERGGHPVEKRPMRQWMLKITAYAERLLEDLDALDWPESTKEHQRNWIGKSEGARVKFAVKGQNDLSFDIFTTRPDTLMGVTFMVLAPEHPLVQTITSDDQRAKVEAYQKAAAAKTDLARTDLNKDKSGVFTGGYAVHPISGKDVPVWIADYVLMGYGTGAIMAVPAHDERDQEFAEAHSLPIVSVIDENNVMQNSNAEGFEVDGLSADEAFPKFIELIEAKGLGAKEVNYKLRDWVFSRQRYWGEPIPVLHPSTGPLTGEVQLLPDSELPLELPEVEDYKPSGTGESPLSTNKEWMNYKKGEEAFIRESNTMPGSAGSSWYFLRYMDPANDSEAWSQDAVKYWKNVDFYLGGSEHAVGHLLYARFWHKFLFDEGLLPTSEPFQKLVHQGMILGEDGEKMSKSRGNVINPDDVVDQFGADAFRMYEMFMGPLEKTKPWNTGGLEGTYRFLNRICKTVLNADGSLSEVVRDIPEDKWAEGMSQSLHRTIKQVGEAIEKLSHNTAISALMILLNDASKQFDGIGGVPEQWLKSYTQLLAPFAPHTAEELWSLLGEKQSVTQSSWPEYDEEKVKLDEIELGVQVNGKIRARVTVDAEISEEDLKALVLEQENVKKWVDGKPLKKFVYVKGRIVSVVV